MKNTLEKYEDLKTSSFLKVFNGTVRKWIRIECRLGKDEIFEGYWVFGRKEMLGFCEEYEKN